MVRRVLRLSFAAAAVLVGGVVIRAAIALDHRRGQPPLQGLARRAQRGWCRLFCRAFGIRLEPGERALADPPVLIAANHVSWLDIVVLAAHWPVVFLSKSEVARWPIIGGVANDLGTLFIQRGGPSAARDAIDRMRSALDQGGMVVFFPEGTTSDSNFLRPFRPRLFQAAIDADTPVQPVALSYSQANGTACPNIAFTDDQSLVANVWALAGVPSVVARVQPTPPVVPEGQGRNQLATTAREHMLAVLGLDA